MSKTKLFELDHYQEIWHTISRNKLRSILTMFGVGWGILMLVLMTGAGNGLQNGMMGGVKDFAANSCFMLPQGTTQPYKGFQKGRWWSLRMSDIELLRRQIPELKYIAPITNRWSSSSNTLYKDRSYNASAMGTTPDFFQTSPVDVIAGRNINEIDLRESRKVCVIGDKVYNQLFRDDPSLIGEYIRFDGIYYQVVGVVKSRTQISISGPIAEKIVIPQTTMARTYNMGDRFDFLGMTAENGVSISTLEDKIREVVYSAHEIAPTDKDASWILNVEQQFKMFSNLFLGISILVWIVGMGTLLSGVISVSNIMVVTVQERTKEIGIRRALGALPSEIRGQIVKESVILTVFAGLIGMTIGVGLLVAVNILMGDQPDIFFKDAQISLTMALSSLAVLIVSGLFAGLIPAQRAMRIKAIDAIREE